MREYSFNSNSPVCTAGVAEALAELSDCRNAVIINIGSDIVTGDSLAPIVGSILKAKAPRLFSYGDLNNQITALDVEKVFAQISGLHCGTLIVAVDAAIGNQSDIGTVKVVDRGLKPGLGVNKNLMRIGEIGIMGVVAAKSNNGIEQLRETTLETVVKLSRIIADAIIATFAPKSSAM